MISLKQSIPAEKGRGNGKVWRTEIQTRTTVSSDVVEARRG